jgi:hypothetical protein
MAGRSIEDQAFFLDIELQQGAAKLRRKRTALRFNSSNMANINNELAMTNQSKGRVLMASKSKLALKTKATSDADDTTSKKPTSSKGDAGLGRRAELLDHERAVGRPITYAGDRYPMQSAPDHGPHK